MTISRLKEVIKMLPQEISPRLGGSLNLYLRGEVDRYRDIDIIVDDISKVDLPFPKIELVHKERLNPTIKYCVDGREIDVIESLFSKTVVEHDPIMGIDFEPMDVVFKAKLMIENFLNTTEQPNNHDAL